MISMKSPEEIAQQYLQVLVRAVRALPNNTLRSRAEIYKRAERAQKLSISAVSEPVEPEEADFHYLLFRTVRNMLESDIRAGLNVFDPEYYPDQLAESARNLAERRDRRLARKHAVAAREARQSSEVFAQEIAPEFEQPVRDLWTVFVNMDSGRPNTGPFLRAMIAFRTLFILQAQIISGQSVFSLIWIFLQPVALLAAISVTYFLLMLQHILNMDIPTFALLGATTWIMFRRNVIVTASCFRTSRPYINIPLIRPATFATVQSSIYLVVYSLVLVTAIAYVNWAGWSHGPNDPLMLVVYFLGMWLISVCLGFCTAGISVFWPFFLRIAAILFGRVLEIFSSVFYVSEQFPEAYKPYILWAPTAHGMQLLRQAYFAGYVSTDASPRYFWGSVLFLVVAATMALRVTAARIEPL